MQIEIPEPLLKRLQKDAIPFVDTPVSVIERLADFYERHNSQKSEIKSDILKQPQTVKAPNDERKFDPHSPPNLFHTTVRGEFGTISFSKWNDLLQIAHVQTFKKTKSFDELRKATRAQIKNGTKTNEGYRPIPEIGISIQGVDANHAWKHALRLAIYLNVPLKAEIEWRHKDEAAFPGERGILAWAP
jgi:hypothetical protein